MTEGDDPTRPEPTRAETSFAWTPELASGHLPGETPVPRRSRSAGPLWTAAIVICSVAAIVGLGGASGDDASEASRAAGRAVGTAFAPLIWGFLIWGVVVLVGRVLGRRPSLRGPAIPVIALVFILLGLIVGSWPVRSSSGPESGAVTTATPSPSPSPSPRTFTLDEALRIGAPYRLGDPIGSEEAGFADQFTGGRTGDYRSVTVKRIYKGSALVGYAIVADAKVRAELVSFGLAGVEMGLAKESNVTTTRQTINGREVITGVGDGFGYSIWIEPPFVKAVIGLDGTELRDVLATFVTP